MLFWRSFCTSAWVLAVHRLICVFFNYCKVHIYIYMFCNIVFRFEMNKVLSNSIKCNPFSFSTWIKLCHIRCLNICLILAQVEHMFRKTPYLQPQSTVEPSSVSLMKAKQIEQAMMWYGSDTKCYSLLQFCCFASSIMLTFWRNMPASPCWAESHWPSAWWQPLERSQLATAMWVPHLCPNVMAEQISVARQLLSFNRANKMKLFECAAAQQQQIEVWVNVWFRSC